MLVVYRPIYTIIDPLLSYQSEGQTPTIALDKAFADALGLMHCEEDYFQRLAPTANAK